MSRETTLTSSVALILGIGLILVGPQVCHADPVCDDNNGNSPYVCVNKSGPEPEPGTDFELDFQTDPDNPGVTFYTGNDAWEVWSQEGKLDDTPANLGDIKIDPTVSTDDFEVTIAHGALAGAANLGSAVLTDAGWTGYSSIDGGKISGDLTGDLTVQKSSGGSGGSASFTISGDAEGDITIPTVSSLIIDGATSGNIEIAVLVGPLGIEDLSGTGSINVTEKIDGGSLGVSGTMGSMASIDIAQMIGTGELVEFGYESELAGDLSLQSGVAVGQTVMICGSFTGSVDLHGNGVAGDLMIPGGGTGKIFNGGAVTGTVGLAESLNTFSGEATFASIAYGAYVKACFANINGTIHITGNMNGQIMTTGIAEQGTGSLLEPGDGRQDRNGTTLLARSR